MILVPRDNGHQCSVRKAHALFAARSLTTEPSLSSLNRSKRDRKVTHRGLPYLGSHHTRKSTMFPNMLTPANLYQNMLRSPLVQHTASRSGTSASFLMENILRERACAAVMPRPLTQQQLQQQLQQQHTLHLQQQQHQQHSHQHLSALASVGLGLGIGVPSQKGGASGDHSSPISGQSSPVSDRSIDQSKPTMPTSCSLTSSHNSELASPSTPLPSSISSPLTPPLHPHTHITNPRSPSPVSNSSPFMSRATPTAVATPTQAGEAAMLSIYASAQQQIHHEKQQQQQTTPFLKFGVNAILGNTESSRRSPPSGTVPHNKPPLLASSPSAGAAAFVSFSTPSAMPPLTLGCSKGACPFPAHGLPCASCGPHGMPAAPPHGAPRHPAFFESPYQAMLRTPYFGVLVAFSSLGGGVGGTVASESALRSAGTLLSRVRAQQSASWPDGGPKA
ncbi:hypothetical protein PoB_004461500 [Plakobranchus ocellatus]|uniref:Uncharacterized protein n=1 Tax=Plakobranchus ocellatus TaxID=259542 RepID=A0AAV4BEX5_9GAST|nr:hypothetical protein PoB_004461500 [Plakobranchus ocellatus]